VRNLYAIMAIVAMLAPAAALAHGIEATVDDARAVVVTVAYESGEPLSFETAEVLPPGGGPPFQAGRTDRLGRVVFVPDRIGSWTVKVTSEGGHGTVVRVPVDETRLAGGAAASGGGQGRAAIRNGRWSRLVTGVGVLLGVFGVVSLALRRRS